MWYGHLVICYHTVSIFLFHPNFIINLLMFLNVMISCAAKLVDNIILKSSYCLPYADVMQITWMVFNF